MTGSGLKDDCFALPRGVHWTPVDQALAGLRDGIRAVTDVERLRTRDALGRILAEQPRAERSNPESANSAVDGYGFAHASLSGERTELPVVRERASAGHPASEPVPPGWAVRVLTGAVIPDGVDTVILDEDSEVGSGKLTVAGTIRKGANVRGAGEDVARGDSLLESGHQLRPQDLALLTASGIAEVTVRRRLKVGVMSTGDEICQPGDPVGPGMVYDANRPMILSLVRCWGHSAVDAGHVVDSRDALRKRMNETVDVADAIIVSGGASAGDEDHVSALFADEGDISFWRIAVKPGRPLALARWLGTPVFGLPGNPVAAFVCSLVFARPALAALAGGQWTEPKGFVVPAAFHKRKKAGRREYLRAQITERGEAEPFRSEGSGLITGLTWSEGLVELEDQAYTIRRGDPVRYLPYSSFGL